MRKIDEVIYEGEDLLEISITYQSDRLRMTPKLGSGGDWLYLGGVERFGYEEKLLTAVNFCSIVWPRVCQFCERPR